MIIHDKTPSLWRLFLVSHGSILPKIWKRVLYLDLIAVVVCILYLHYHWHFIDLTVAPFTIIGLVLGLFVSFRNNTSYERYWEARTLWSNCMITCRNLTRQALVYGQSCTHHETQSRVYLLIAYAHALKNHLRDTHADNDICQWLPERDRQATIDSPCTANHILTLIAHSFYLLHQKHALPAPIMAQIDILISDLGNTLGGCERIKTTPIPYAYTLLIHRTLHVYCWLLPFGLVDSIGYMTPIVVSFMAYAFLGLDALGDQITSPFSKEPNALALDSICRQIEINLLTELGEPYPDNLLPKHGILS